MQAAHMWAGHLDEEGSFEGQLFVRSPVAEIWAAKMSLLPRAGDRQVRGTLTTPKLLFHRRRSAWCQAECS